MVKTDEWEVINSASALWTRSKSEITEEQYIEFYKNLSHDFAEPLAWAHNRVEEVLNIRNCCISQVKQNKIYLPVKQKLALSYM